MASSADLLRSADQRALRLRARRDLQVVRAAVAGQGLFVVRDPVTQNVFQLTEQEYRLLDKLQAPATLRSLQEFFERQFAPLRTTTSQLQHFLQRLYDMGLLLSEQAGQGASLHRRGARRTWMARLMSLLQVLSIRLGGVTPGAVSDVLNSRFGWLFSAVGFVLVFSLWVAAGGVLAANGGQLAMELLALDALFTSQMAAIWIASIVVVKVLHELGHATACRRFGGQCQEIGVLLLAGLPTLYCDVSDAWRFKSKWKRMAVSAAGMYVELIITALAVLAWRFTHPGVIHSICVSLIVVCSVGTLLVNANPLLRYDGYYLLSDWLDVPNLAERSRGLWTGLSRRWLLGERIPDDPLLGPGKRAGLRVYAVIARVYLFCVLAAIFAMLLKFARPYRLENVVYTAAALTLIGMMVQPAMAAARLVRSPLTRGRIRKWRLAGTLFVLAGCTAAVLAWPITRRVSAPVVLLPANCHPLYATAAGSLEYAATPGQEVKVGDVVVRLGNDESDLQIARQQGEVVAHRTRLNQLLTLRTIDPTVNELIPTARANLADAEAQLAELRDAAEALTIRAPASGRLLPPPDFTPPRAQRDVLPSWQGSPLAVENLGAWIEPQTALAAVAEGDRLVAWAGVDQADIGFIEPGQVVRLATPHLPTAILRGTVKRISRTSQSNRPDGSQTEDDDPEVGSDYHVVEIAVNETNPSGATLVGARGQVKIETQRTTVGDVLLSQIRRVVRTSL